MTLSSLRRTAMRAGAAMLLVALPAVAGAQDKPGAKPQSDLDKVGDTAESIVEKPLKDLNLIKDAIPPALLAVMDKPYSLAGISNCAQFSAEIARMTEVLGPDVDVAKPRKGETTTEAMLGGVQSVAGGLVPGSGLMRKISGADAAQKKANAAVLAGSLRRAYLKGGARAKGCKV